MLTMFQFPMQHFAEHDPLGGVFGAFWIQFSNQVHMRTQMDGKQMGNFVKTTIINKSSGFLEDEV